jgi:phenylalanyl-tRNA synthetase beta chain
VVESALWNPLNIAQTGRKLGMQSPTRAIRFERGVDPAFMVPGLELATQLVLELCGGVPSEVFIAGEVPDLRAASSISRFPNRSASPASKSKPDEIKRILSISALHTRRHRRKP